MADDKTWRPPRACDDYWSEWKHCRSIPNLFHHYYTYGEVPSCKQWKRDYENCREWEKTKSTTAKDSLCKSERERITEKQKHVAVWDLRKSPPLDWYLPIDEDKPNTEHGLSLAQVRLVQLCTHRNAKLCDLVKKKTHQDFPAARGCNTVRHVRMQLSMFAEAGNCVKLPVQINEPHF